MMKVRFVGESFYALGLTNGKIYECLGVEFGLLRIIDDEGYAYWPLEEGEKEGYLYSAVAPCAPDGSSPPGRWEIIEDDENGTLAKAISGKSTV